MKKYTKNEVVLFIMEFIKTCVGQFTGPFLVALFISETLSNIKNYSIYKLVGNIVVIIACFIVSRIIKKKNKMISFRIGIIINSIYLLSLVIFKDSFIEHSWFIGVLLGISNSVYYMPYNYILSNTIRPEIMNRWSSIKNMNNHIIGVILPIILGVLLSKYEYTDIAIIFVIVQLSCLIITFFYDDREKKTCSFSLRKFFFHIKESNAENIFKNLFIIDFINGFVLSDSALSTIITLFVLLSFKTNLSLGIFTSVFTLVNIIISYLFSKLKNRKKYTFYMILSSFLIIINMIIFILFTNNITFILYNLFYNVASVLISIITFSDTFNLSNSVQSIKRSFQVEFLTVREWFLSLGRILSFVLLFMAGIINKVIVYQLLLLIFSLCIVIMVISSIKIEKDSK